jgi:hypothetical protein
MDTVLLSPVRAFSALVVVIVSATERHCVPGIADRSGSRSAFDSTKNGVDFCPDIS